MKKKCLQFYAVIACLVMFMPLAFLCTACSAKVYNLGYELDGGVNGENPLTYQVQDELISLTNPTKAGYDFGGWYLDADYTMFITALDSHTKADVTLYAKWTPTVYKITYQNVAGVTANDNVTQYNIEDAEITLKDVTKTGYNFLGWYTEDTYEHQVTTIDTEAITDMTLYAKWATVIYKITYQNVAEVTANDNVTQYNIEDAEITLKDVAKTGYNFLGWYTEDTYEHQVTTIDTGAITDVTLYAKWTPTVYKITYQNVAEVTANDNVTQYNIEDANITLKDVAKTGYNFLGWYTEDTYEHQVTTIDTNAITDVTLYAKWEIKRLKITYQQDDVTLGEEIVVYGTAFENLTADLPGCNDHFVFSLVDGTPVTETTIFTDDTIVMVTVTPHNGPLTSILSQNVDNIPHSGCFVCDVCGATYYDSVNCENLQMPILDLFGTLPTTKEAGKLKISAVYEAADQSFACDATAKLQGGASVNYDKKNYNLQFFQTDTNYKDKYKVKLFSEGTKESKYCIKANYAEFSQARNVVTGKIYNQIVKTRDFDDEVSQLFNGGVVDGYPILVYINGECQGLYTINIHKDNLFKIKDDDGTGNIKQAVLMGDNIGKSTSLREHMNSDFSNGWDLQVCSTEDTVGTDWVAASFNAMMDFVNDNDGEAFRNGIREYVQLERTLDTLIFTLFIMGIDNTSHNLIWVTYDGKTWLNSPYDLDLTWGNNPHWKSDTIWNMLSYVGDYYFNPNTLSDEFLSDINYVTRRGVSGVYYVNNLWKKLYVNFYDEIVARYQELRASVLTAQNIDQQFGDFFAQIPDLAYQYDLTKWSIPYEAYAGQSNNYAQIIEFAVKRLAYLDQEFAVTVTPDSVYEVNFDLDPQVEVKVFASKNYELRGDFTTVAYARDSDTGYLLADGNGQVNFEVVCAPGYEVDQIEIVGKYKNLKEPDNADVARPNTYRVTKIKSALTIKITVRECA